MDDFLKMDIFFIVATLAVIAVTALVVLALVRIVRILGHVEKISGMVEDESQLVRGDIAEMRANIRTEGFKFKHLMQFVRVFARRTFGSRK
ncbi:MAG TPA: hypothetical protein VJH91_02410 [Candidatus Paceibacterota bacterium]